MTNESSREERIRYLLRVSKAIIVRADALLQGDTEYLREELDRLMESYDVLLEKMNFEQLLLETRDELHDVAPEGSHATLGAEAGTGVRVRLAD